MADFGGFQIKTPQEVLAEMASTQQAIQQLPPRQARNANIQYQIANMFGNPELKKAQDLEKSMSLAQRDYDNSTEAEPGGLDYEHGRLKKLFSVVAQRDPEAASQIQQRLLEVENAQEERDRLRAEELRAENRDDRAEVQSENQAAESRLRQRRAQQQIADADLESIGKATDVNNVYVETVDADGAPVYKAYDLASDDPVHGRAAFERDKLNGIIRFRDEVPDTSRDLANIKLASISGHEKKMERLGSTQHSLRQGMTIMNTLHENIGANTRWGDVVGFTNDIAQDAKGFLNEKSMAKDGVPLNEREDKLMFQAWVDEVDAWADRTAEDKALIAGMTLNLAYSLARSLDGGRLSDQDVEMAKRMIAATNGDPSALARVMSQQLISTANTQLQGVRSSLSVLTPQEIRGSVQARQLLQQQANLEASMEQYRGIAVDQTGFLIPEEYAAIIDPSTETAGNLREARQLRELQQQNDRFSEFIQDPDRPRAELSEADEVELLELQRKQMRGEMLTLMERIKLQNAGVELLGRNRPRGQ